MDVLSNLTRTGGTAQVAVPLLPLALCGSTYFDSAPVNGTITLTAKAAFGLTFQQFRGLVTSAGTCTITLQINGTNVTGLTNVNVTTTSQDVTATAANVVAVGDRVTLVISSVSSAANLEFTMQFLRNS